MGRRAHGGARCLAQVSFLPPQGKPGNSRQLTDGRPHGVCWGSLVLSVFLFKQLLDMWWRRNPGALSYLHELPEEGASSLHSQGWASAVHSSHLKMRTQVQAKLDVYSHLKISKGSYLNSWEIAPCFTWQHCIL